jgi:hypothetical protein
MQTGTMAASGSENGGQATEDVLDRVSSLVMVAGEGVMLEIVQTGTMMASGSGHGGQATEGVLDMVSCLSLVAEGGFHRRQWSWVVCQEY